MDGFIHRHYGQGWILTDGTSGRHGGGRPQKSSAASGAKNPRLVIAHG